MTEADWLSSTDTKRMLRFLGRRASVRKLRLFACACCRRVWPLLTDDRSRAAVEVAERFADGQATEPDRVAACQAAADLDWQINREEGEGDTSRGMAHVATVSAVNDDRSFLPTDGDDEDFRAAEDSAHCAAVTVEYQFPRVTHRNAAQRGKAQRAARAAEQAVQVAMLRDIFGNPFRPLVFERRCRSADTLDLARGIYDEREFDRLPILADALQDAGCELEELLRHCRGPGPHLRGCWALDLVLGRE